MNNGIVYSGNPCLGAGSRPSELAWAERYEQPAILYANTANPGPALSSHWPAGQSFPRVCDPARPDSVDCAYDYGWNAAADSYQRAVDALAGDPRRGDRVRRASLLAGGDRAALEGAVVLWQDGLHRRPGQVQPVRLGGYDANVRC